MVVLSISTTTSVRSSPSAVSKSKGEGRSRGTEARSGGNSSISNSNTTTPPPSKLPSRKQKLQQKLMNNTTQGWSGKPAASSLLLNPAQDAGRAGTSDSMSGLTAAERGNVGVGAGMSSFVPASASDRGSNTRGGFPGSATDSSASGFRNGVCARNMLDGAVGSAGCFGEDGRGDGCGPPPVGGEHQEESYLDDLDAEDDGCGRNSGGGGGGSSVLVEGDSRDSGGSGGDTSDNSDNSLGAGMTEPKGLVVAGSGLPPPPPIRAPSAYSTPDGSPRHPRGGRVGAGDVFVSPMGSPWPAGGLGSASREAGGGAAAGDRFCRGRVNK